MIELPMPPEELREESEYPLFVRDRRMEEWLRELWIESSGAFGWTGDFEHLQDAEIGFLWTNVGAPVAGTGGSRQVAGTAEMFAPRPGRKWVVERQNAFMYERFGPYLPTFILTFSAPLWADPETTVATNLGLSTHELLHCGQALDGFGNPKVYTSGPRKGMPVYCIRPHDVEQFVLVARFFGARAAGVEELVAAANAKPLFLDEFGEVQPFACGSCLKAA